MAEARSLKRRFTLPNELFSLGLSSNEISVYAYLLYCENRKTHQCWPSYNAISRAVGLSRKTVKKYVTELVDKGLITTENTTITTRDGRKRNGRLLFKQSVEMGILSHIIAADTDVDQATLQRLRGRCVDDVKRTNGQILFKDILQFQREV